ncbi:hypothetical protein DPMN_028138 [Dreissena polymorpha]|uniref:Uncharacterized protein n=2 Tax=Dreissena polymorpha TaxID=45954 RepID=A0A9D4LWF7_DREPO|nr:hypothetical protein DPMN_028138 [Dreissena polymorpha]
MSGDFPKCTPILDLIEPNIRQSHTMDIIVSRLTAPHGPSSRTQQPWAFTPSNHGSYNHGIKSYYKQHAGFWQTHN